MEITLKKQTLFNFLKNRLNEDSRADMFATPENFSGFGDIEDDSPIEATPYTSVQLAEQEPPVDDPEYVPASLEELSLAAHVMMREVPRNQIEFVYRFLHKILDMSLDKEDERDEDVLLEALTPEQMQAVRAALPRVLSGEPLDRVSSQLADSLEVEQQEVETALGDAMMSGLEPEIPPASPSSQQPDSSANRPPSPPRQKVLRRARRSSGDKPGPKPPPNLPAAAEFEDVETKIGYENAQDKESFLAGYNIGLDDSVSQEQKSDNSAESQDYQAGYNAGFKEYEDDGKDKSNKYQVDLDDLQVALVDLTDLSDTDAITKVATQTKLGLEMFALSIEGYHNIAFTTSVRASDAERRLTPSEERTIANLPHKKYNIDNEDTFFIQNYRKHPSKFSDKNKVVALANHQISVFNNHGLDFAGSTGSDIVKQLRLKSAGNFKSNIRNLTRMLGENKDIVIRLLSEVIASYFVENEFPNIGLLGDEKEALDKKLQTIFAFTVRYPENLKEKKNRPYQSNNTNNFELHTYSSDYDEQILKDFAANVINPSTPGYIRFDNKKKKYRIPSGKRGLTYYVSEDDLETAIEEYTKLRFMNCLERQESASKEKEERMRQIEAEKSKPKSRKKREVDEAFFRDHHEMFGMKYPAFRQDVLKFPDRIYKLFFQKSLQEDPNRTAVKVHRNSIQSVVSILAKNLGSIYSEELEGLRSKAESENFELTPEISERLPFLSIAEEMHDHVMQANKQIRSSKIKDGIAPPLLDIRVTGTGADGRDEQLVFSDSLGGMLARNINGKIMRKFLVKFDQDITAVVTNKLLHDEKYRAKMARNIQNPPAGIEIPDYLNGKPLDANNLGIKKDKKNGIDGVPAHKDIAKSIAEYWTGKKSAPDLELINKYDEEFDEEYVTKAFEKSGKDGTYKRKGGAEALLKHGIDGEMYIDIARLVSKYIDETAFVKFNFDESGENYRDLFEKEQINLSEKDAYFKKVVIEELNNIMSDLR